MKYIIAILITPLAIAMSIALMILSYIFVPLMIVVSVFTAIYIWIKGLELLDGESK